MHKFSKSWVGSKKPSKQRKYRYNAPLHIRQKFVAAHLSKELKAKYKKRAINLRKSDTVKVMRGRFKRHTGKVERIDLKAGKVYVSGVELTKKDGTKSFIPLQPSNLLIIEISVEDKKRLKR